MPDYFLIGPSLELRTLPDSFECEGPELQAWSFGITQGERTLGRACARISPRGVSLWVESPAPLPESHLGEALRLFARLCGILTGYARPLLLSSERLSPELLRSLAKEGFQPTPDGSLLERRPGPFVLPEEDKAPSNPEVYRDFFTVPWNFVPREWDVMEKAARDLGAGPGADPEDLAERRILDLGCGCGKNSTVLEAMGFQVHGLDISEPAIQRCRQLVRHGERFVQGSAEALPWPDRYFDAVLDIGCLHSAPEAILPQAVAEIARVLNPRGLLYSRSFKPRPAEWVKAMPIRMDHFGISLERLMALLEPRFTASVWMKHEVFNYIQAMPR
jgi:SAM-dependent methyltransferase